MNIIIEGCDKSGKSTIAGDIREALQPKTPVSIKLVQKPVDLDPTMVKKMYIEFFHQANSPLNKDHLFLFDRSYPSEMVYSAKRKYDAMKDLDLRKLDFDLGRTKQTLLIYCEVDFETLKKRFDKEKEAYLKKEEIQMILERYEQFLAITSVPYIRVNSLKDRGANLAAVREFLKV